MSKTLDRQMTKQKAVDYAVAMKTILQQLALQDGTQEALEAARLLGDSMSQAIPDVQSPAKKHPWRGVKLFPKRREA